MNSVTCCAFEKLEYPYKTHYTWKLCLSNKFEPNFGKTCNANGCLTLCTLGDLFSSLDLQDEDINDHIDDFQDLDEVDDKTSHTVIFYLASLHRKN